jgi:hypothetical protein
VWGVPNEDVHKLHELVMKAKDLLEKGMKSVRTPVITAEIQAAFAELREHMRYMKRRWFTIPPQFASI